VDLKTFVEETLVQLIAATKTAAEKTSSMGAKIVPTLPPAYSKNATVKLGLFESWGGELGDMVEFDLAITASATSGESQSATGGSKGGANIHVLSASIGGELETKSQSEARDSRVSRVKFRIPVVLPHLPMPK
jgi:hypothetical protein